MTDPGPVIAALAFAYGAAAVGVLGGLLGRAWLRRGGRRPSAAEAAWCAFLPLVAMPVLPFAGALHPPIGGYLGGAHDQWHAWVQGVHATPSAHGALHAANLLLLAMAVTCLVRTTFALARQRAFAAEMRAAARPVLPEAGSLPVYELPSSRPACFTLGVRRPAIYLTTGLMERLSPRDVEAVLAHEASHVVRRDGLTGALLAAFYTLVPLPGGRLLRAEWEGAAERACDAAAARRLGSPCDVAAALLHVARLVNGLSPAVPGAMAFQSGAADLQERVQALLAMPAPVADRPDRREPVSALLIVVTVAGITLLSFGLQHGVEFLVGH